MQICLECGKGFERIKPNQRFCPGGKCRSRYHNKEKGQGLMLTPRLRAGLRALADAHDVTENEMACIMIHQMMNPDQRPLSDGEIYGKVKEQNGQNCKIAEGRIENEEKQTTKAQG